MKIKFISIGLVLVLATVFFSFKAIGEKESSNVAIVNTVFGKTESTGFLISYGDGTMELKNYEFKRNSSENHLQSLSTSAQIMNVLHEKGYRFSGMGQHTVNDLNVIVSYMIFEKK